MFLILFEGFFGLLSNICFFSEKVIESVTAQENGCSNTLFRCIETVRE